MRIDAGPRITDIRDSEPAPALKRLGKAILAAYRGDDRRAKSNDACVPDWPPSDYLSGYFVLGQFGSSMGGAV